MSVRTKNEVSFRMLYYAVKIIAVDKGFYIPGGTQLYGKFLSLKRCMKACALAPSCFSADYNPWLRKCYQHSNYTACNTRKSHSQFVHFSKVPCSKSNVVDDDDDDDAAITQSL